MKPRGFTMVEIMIVVATISLLAAISIPNLLRARMHANEGAAQAALRTFATAQVEYRAGNSRYASLAELGAPSAGPAYIDAVLATGVKSGYSFAVTDVDVETFHVSAEPVAVNGTGTRSFCVTEDGVVRANTTGSAIPDHDSCFILPSTSP